MGKTICKIGDLSKGADGFPPSPLVSTPVTKTYIKGKLVGVVGAIYAPHTLGTTTHHDEQRKIITGSDKFFVEGYAVARTDDLIADGDKVGETYDNGSA